MNEEGYEGRGKMSILPLQFHCEPKTALKIKSFLKKHIGNKILP